MNYWEQLDQARRHLAEAAQAVKDRDGEIRLLTIGDLGVDNLRLRDLLKARKK